MYIGLFTIFESLVHTMDLFNKRILILGGSEFQIPLLLEAKKNNMYIGLVDYNESAPAKVLADEYFRVSLKNSEEVLSIAKQFNPDGVTVGIVDPAVVTCAYVAKKLGLPGISEKSSILATNKFEMIKRFE